MTKRLGPAEDIYIYIFFFLSFSFSRPPVIHYDAPCFLSTLPSPLLPRSRFRSFCPQFLQRAKRNFTVIRNDLDDAFDSFEYMWRCQVFLVLFSPKLYDPLPFEPSTYIYPAPNFFSSLLLVLDIYCRKII